jgi:hypothetical protein
MHIRTIALAVFAATSLQAHADTVALWDYTAGTTKHTFSANGASFAACHGRWSFRLGTQHHHLRSTEHR